MKLYAFLSQIIPYGDSDLERLASFGRALLPHLQPDRDSGAIHLGDDVDLAYYRLQRVSSGAIGVGEEEGAYVTGPTAVGTGNPEEEQAPLSEIIERLNERFGTEFTEEDRLFFEQVKERGVRNEDIRQMALANPYDKFALGIRGLIQAADAGAHGRQRRHRHALHEQPGVRRDGLLRSRPRNIPDCPGWGGARSGLGAASKRVNPCAHSGNAAKSTARALAESSSETSDSTAARNVRTKLVNLAHGSWQRPNKSRRGSESRAAVPI